MTPGADGLDLLERCAAQRDGRFADIRPLTDALRARGWTDERLAKNDLAEPRRVPGRDYDYARFWATVARLASELSSLDLPPIFIKCVREYRYCDSNVDVLVPRRQLRRVAEHLYRSDWRAPAPWDTFEQLLIERDKLKLPATRPGLIAAHLYGGVSWRYQSDIGLLRHDGVQPNPRHLVSVPLARYVEPAAAAVPGDLQIWLPGDAAEFVLQAAHVAFENYRLTVGEAVHFQLLRRRAAASWEEARALARRYGCAEALSLIDRESLRVCSALPELDPADYPQTLPITSVLPPLGERGRLLSGERRNLAALSEVATASAVYLGVSAIRKLRRLRRGVEDYR